MSQTVILVVLLAAILHASWNFLVKRADDKLLSMSAVVFGHLPFSIVVLFFVPLPAWEAWPYLLASIVFHTGYQWFLYNAYRIGDLSKVYPLARGVAPLLVTIVSITALGVVLSKPELLGITMIGIGITSLALVRSSSGHSDLKAVALALITGCFITAYSLTDGLGARAALSPVGYYAVSAIGSALVWYVYVIFKRPGLVRTLISNNMKLTLMSGGASYIAYTLAVWAFTQAPIALVTALRETSIIFAMLLGALILKERMGWQKILAVVVTITGVLILKLNQI